MIKGSSNRARALGSGNLLGGLPSGPWCLICQGLQPWGSHFGVKFSGSQLYCPKVNEVEKGGNYG